MTRVHLPAEVLREIVGFLEPASVYDSEAINSLKVCRLASRGLEVWATKVLFRTVKVQPTGESLERLHRVATDPVIGPLVANVHIDLRSADYGRCAKGALGVLEFFYAGFAALFASSMERPDPTTHQFGELPTRAEMDKAAEIWGSWVWAYNNRDTRDSAAITLHKPKLQGLRCLWAELRQLQQQERVLRTGGQFSRAVARALGGLKRPLNIVISTPPDDLSLSSPASSRPHPAYHSYASFRFNRMVEFAKSGILTSTQVELVPPVDVDDHRDISIALVRLLAEMGDAQVNVASLRLNLEAITFQDLLVGHAADITTGVKLSQAGKHLREFFFRCNRDLIFLWNTSPIAAVREINLLLMCLVKKADLLERMAVAVQDDMEHTSLSLHFDLAPTLLSRSWFGGALKELRISGVCLNVQDFAGAFFAPDDKAEEDEDGETKAEEEGSVERGQGGGALELYLNAICLCEGTWAELLSGLRSCRAVAVKQIGGQHKGGEKDELVKLPGGWMMWGRAFREAEEFLDDTTGTLPNPFSQVSRDHPGLYNWIQY